MTVTIDPLVCSLLLAVYLIIGMKLGFQFWGRRRPSWELMSVLPLVVLWLPLVVWAIITLDDETRDADK